MARNPRFSEEWVKVPATTLTAFTEAAEVEAGKHAVQSEIHNLCEHKQTAEPPAEARANVGDTIVVEYTSSPETPTGEPVETAVEGEIQDVLDRGFLFTTDGVEFRVTYAGYGGWKLDRKHADEWGDVEFQAGEASVTFPGL